MRGQYLEWSGPMRGQYLEWSDPLQEDEGGAAPAQPGQPQHRGVRTWWGRADSDREVQRPGSLLSGPAPQQGGRLGQETQQLRPQLQRTGQSGDTAGSQLLIIIVAKLNKRSTIYHKLLLVTGPSRPLREINYQQFDTIPLGREKDNLCGGSGGAGTAALPGYEMLRRLI